MSGAPPTAAGTRARRRTPRITILDYGVGNLHSLIKALARAGGDVRVETVAAAALDADLLVLPGVGAFAAAAQHLAPDRLSIREALGRGLPALGICLGMQLLFESSEEGSGEGLALLRGQVTRLRARRVPHMGWNTIGDRGTGRGAMRTDAVLERSGLTEAYYAHAYVCRPMDSRVVAARIAVGGDPFPTVVRWRATIGVQFHPEKSSAAGLRFLGEVIAGAQRVSRSVASRRISDRWPPCP